MCALYVQYDSYGNMNGNLMRFVEIYHTVHDRIRVINAYKIHMACAHGMTSAKVLLQDASDPSAAPYLGWLVLGPCRPETQPPRSRANYTPIMMIGGCNHVDPRDGKRCMIESTKPCWIPCRATLQKKTQVTRENL